MTIQFRHAVAAGSALLLAAGLAGCATGAVAAGTKTSPSSEASAQVTLDPLSEYLRVDMSDFDENMRKMEEISKQCMEEQGFEYTIDELSPTPQGTVQETPIGILLPRESVAEMGFGIADAAVETAYVPLTDAELEAKREAEGDVQSAYIDALPEAQQEAYWKAYYGKKAGASNPDDVSVEESGCNGKALLAVEPKWAQARPPIIEEAELFIESLRTNEKLTSITDEVTQCMTSSGYAENYVEDLQSRVATFAEANPSATPEDAEVVKLQKEDVTMALAEWDCKEKVDYYERGLATLAELEKDYIADHKSELEEARLWING